MKKASDLILLIGTPAILLWSFLVGAADAPFVRPELARIFFWHFPSSIVLTVLLFMGGYFSFRVVNSPSGSARRAWDVRATSALELGLFHSCVTMLTGIVFSYAQWGQAWHWDPRQTSFLLFLLFYGAYFALRNAFNDEEKRETHSAAYMLAALMPMLFLVFVYPRLPAVKQASIHPTNTITAGDLTGSYLWITLAALALVALFSARIYRLRVRVELALIDHHGNLETDRRSPASHPVVRPVRLHEADGA